ncbi:MAG TPA: glycosyltransferase family 2 protein [Sphingopyxis sp.]|jgi:glycosyltransferase involved in cell wall biosynthesis|uniref:glycosyltransferase family 2 protein n=1 Tax=Sphingopyxis sp. TaxID=1908224 RepID=UPI002E36B139|nr:glycosyltransferase family 2 protein [Sphingopyxis sp.]HEX2813233.1 glycosyltransferase family 2 protein [Sphingopyxis sp.]
MTKLVIQIPCLNEAEDLPATLAALPRRIAGIDTIEILVIDDGSTDNTAQVAAMWGVQHIVRHRTNRGLAAAFQSGLDAALRAGADILVNTDADGQYAGEDIETIIRPILDGRADIVVGDRGVADNAHFGPLKRRLQRLGSAVVQQLANVQVSDAVSGFRAISREAAYRLNITTEFSYTTDMLIQAGRKRLAILSVPIRTNATPRPSRLFKSVPRFIMNTGITMARVYTTYNPLRAFVGLGLALVGCGLIPILRFLFLFAIGEGSGHIQSLVIGGALLVLGTIIAVMGVLADLIASNRKLIEAGLVRLRAIEDRLGDRHQVSTNDADAREHRRVG